MWNINEVGKEILADISKDIKGPNAMFEISSAAGKGPSEISHKSKGEESNIHKKLVKNNQKALLMVKSFSSLFKLQQITSWANRFIKNCRSKHRITGTLT